MATRPYGKGLTPASSPRYNARYPVDIIPLASGAVKGGINDTQDPADIDDSQVQDALNCRIRFDKLSRRSGTVAYGAAKPNSNKILAVYNFKSNAGISTILRFTAGTIYRDPAGWTAIAGALAGTDTDRLTIAAAFNSVVFANNGVDYLQQINLGANTFARLGNAPKYKFCTVFANRVVGFNNQTAGSINPIEVGWSGDGNITVFDSTTDPSAGSGPLIESPGDLSDYITGGFGFTNLMVVLRERSIVVATIQAIPTNPFNFYTDVAGIGCGCSYSAVVVPGGIAFADHRTRKVYLYSPGQQPIEISTPIESSLFDSITDPSAVIGSYDNRNNEYSIAIPSTSSSTVRTWIFNLRTKAWTYDERSNLSAIADIEGSAGNITIDSLVGTIDSLTGTIDGLVNSDTTATSRLYGFTNGDLQLESVSATDDSGVSYTDRVISKTFTLPVTDEYVCKINYEVLCRSSSTIALSYSKDGGITWILARTDVISTVRIPKLVQYNKQIKCRKLTFKIESSNGDRDLLKYEVHVYRAGISRTNS